MLFKAPPDAVLECVFKKALLGRADAAKLKPPSGTTVLSWLKEDFGINSEHGHTALFPHKSDACSICSSFDVDIDSIKMSISLTPFRSYLTVHTWRFA